MTDLYERAACRGTPDMFFPPASPGGRKPQAGRPDPYARARQVCAGCPVRAQCLEFAIARREQDGMWGGLDPDELRAERSRRQRAERQAARA